MAVFKVVGSMNKGSFYKSETTLICLSSISFQSFSRFQFAFLPLWWTVTNTDILVFVFSFSVVRGKIFHIQDQPTLDTLEISVSEAKILRNNLLSVEKAEAAYRKSDTQTLNAEPRLGRLSTRRKSTTYVHEISDDLQNTNNNHDGDDAETTKISFHRPSHCLTSYGEGEFIFMGRRRFSEIMLVCAPRLEEWTSIIQNYASTNDAPCVLSS